MNFLEGAVIFITGVCAGTAGSYVYFKKQYEKQKEELEEIKEHWTVKINKDIDNNIVDNIIKKERYVAYDNVRKEDHKAVIYADNMPVAVVDSPPEDYPEEAIVITEEDYSERELYFDKIEADYYMDDGSLVDENNELMEPDNTVGYDNLEKFINDESEDILYIRNASTSSDYMVRKVFGKFSDVIGVGGDTDDE